MEEVNASERENLSDSVILLSAFFGFRNHRNIRSGYALKKKKLLHHRFSNANDKFAMKDFLDSFRFF